MPLGSTHFATGRLMHRNGRWTLRVDGGGEWRLDLGWRHGRRARILAERRVEIDGTRDGFDLLHVTRLSPYET